MPNVRAGNDHDLWVGVGYAMAQDRLVQLELFRRATQGRLAEVLGEGRLADDVVARRDYYTLPELRRHARPAAGARCARASTPTPRASTCGWRGCRPTRRCVRTSSSLLDLTPAPWRAVDSASVGVQLARTIPSDDGRELENREALRKLGAKRFNRLLPLRRRRPGRDDPGLRGPLPVQPRPHPQGRARGLQALAALPARPARPEGDRRPRRR